MDRLKPYEGASLQPYRLLVRSECKSARRLSRTLLASLHMSALGEEEEVDPVDREASKLVEPTVPAPRKVPVPASRRDPARTRNSPRPNLFNFAINSN